MRDFSSLKKMKSFSQVNELEEKIVSKFVSWRKILLKVINTK